MKIKELELKFEAFLNRFKPVLTGTHYGETFLIDNRKIINATFCNCTFLYCGGAFKMEDTTITAPLFDFQGNAANTLTVLKLLDKSGGSTAIAETFPNTFASRRGNDY